MTVVHPNDIRRLGKATTTSRVIALRFHFGLCDFTVLGPDIEI